MPMYKIKSNGKVDIWDMGPNKPEEPVEPKHPGDSASLVAKSEYDDAMETHKEAVGLFIRDKKHHREWHLKNQGPARVEMWPADVTHAISIEPERYKLSLPAGKKPGKAQVEADAKAAAEAEEAQRAAMSDPQFGAGAQQGAEP